MKTVRFFAVMGLLLSGTALFAQEEIITPASPELVDAQGNKFFWCKEGVPVALVQEILRLMNTCLEQKVANDTFIEILGKLQEHIKQIELNIEEKTKLQKNIQYLINTLKTQSKTENRELKTMIKAVTKL